MPSGAGIFTTLLTNHRRMIIGLYVSFARVEKMGLAVFREYLYTQHPYVHTASPSSLFPPSVANREPEREKPHPQPLILASIAVSLGPGDSQR